MPAQRDREEAPEVDLVEPLVERLVVRQAAQVDDVADEQVGEVDTDGQEAAGERPAEDGQGPDDAKDGEDDDLEGDRNGSRAQPAW
jgi:hypothetical protein